MPTTHPDPVHLADFALGKLSIDDATEIADHLAGCDECQEAVAAVPDDSVLALVRAAPSVATCSWKAGPSPDAPQDSWVPVELADHPRYRLLEWLGAGGMGVVYQAEHRLMERRVALKIISKKLTTNLAAVERFQREVKAAAKLSHPNIVTAYDAEQAGDLHFLVMEFVEGTNLARLVEDRGPLSVNLAGDYVRQAALGLQHAFEQGMVHRDIKPQNLMLTTKGQVKILDFGLAALAVEPGTAATITEFGQGLGTPDYAAPEQIRDAHAADIRADIYSLGCTLYFLLAGHPPFPEGTARQKVAGHLERTPKPLASIRPDLPASVVQVVERMMTKEPGERFQTPAEVAEALIDYTAPRAARHKLLLLVAAVAAVVIAGAVLARGLVRWTVDTEPPAGGAASTEEVNRASPKTAREYYEEALQLKLRGDSGNAIAALKRYFALETKEYFDPYLTYASLVEESHNAQVARQMLGELVGQKPGCNSARMVALLQEGGPDMIGKLRGLLKEQPDFLPAYPVLFAHLPSDTILEEAKASQVRAEFQKRGGIDRLRGFYLHPAEAERYKDFGLDQPLDPAKDLHLAFMYDSYFKGLSVAFRDKQIGKEVVLRFANDIEARGPLQPLRIGEEHQARGMAIIEIAPGDEIAFQRRHPNDVRIYKHCGKLTGIQPGPLTFTVEYVDAKGNSYELPKPVTITVPVFQAQVIQGKRGSQLVQVWKLRVCPYEAMRSCQVALKKDGEYVTVPEHRSVPTLNEIELSKLPGYDGKPGSQEFWLKGVTKKGQERGPEAVQVLCPDGTK